MRAIGVRELRQRASEYIRQVEAGRTLEVTTRGRAVARLVSIRASALTRVCLKARTLMCESFVKHLRPS